MIKEEQIFKPTVKKPVNDQSKNFEKNFKKTMLRQAPQVAPNIRLNEIDGMLSEAEFSLKKKIFSLPKMEALVFADPKLRAVYDEMSVNGEEKYGYHYNETIMNMIFNDYVLNSPKYLQKYKMAIPKEKKRRDKSGINQAKKAGEETMKKTNPTFKPKKLDPSGLPKQDKKSNQLNEEVTKVQFLVNEKDPENPDLFAYFPDNIHNGEYRDCYSHIGQHSSCHPEYAEESRPATPEEYADLKAELENQIGYELDVINQANETTSAGGAGGAAGYVGYAAPLGYDKKVDETTSAGSAAGSQSYVGYAGPAAWGSGDLMKSKGKSKVMRKPIFPGGTIIAETNYLTDPSGFEKFAENMDNEIIDKTAAFSSDTVKSWNGNDKKVQMDTIKTGQMDRPNFNVAEQANVGKIKTKEQFMAWKQSVGRNMTKEDVPLFAGEVLHKMAIGVANKLISNKVGLGWDDLSDTNSMWDYIDENGGMTYEDFMAAVKEAVNDRISNEDMPFNFDLDENSQSKNNLEKVKAEAQRISKEEGVAQHVNQISHNNYAVSDWYDADKTVISFENGRQLNEMVNEKATSKAQQRLFGMAHAVQKGELSPSKVGGAVKKIAKTVNPDDVEDFASTKHEDLPEKVDEKLTMTPEQNKLNASNIKESIFSSTIKVSPMEFMLGYLRQKYPIMMTANIEADMRDDNVDFVNTQLSSASTHKLRAYAEGLYKQIFGRIKEDTQTMIQNNGTSMSNKPTPAGEQGSGVPMGMQASGGMNEDFIKNGDYLYVNNNEMGLLEELNKELEAFSIHHNKLKVMAEDKKPSSLVMKDRLGGENEKNFKKDLQHSGTKEIIDVEKELQWKDQQTDVGDDPQKLGQDIEKKVLKVTDGNALKNVGDSANDKGDEIPKRNRTDDEQNDVDMHRLGQQDLVYDNEPGKRFEDRMKADMGDKLYAERQKKLVWRSEAPMYNKDPQPVEDTEVDKDQFNREKSMWNRRDGIGESVVSGRYYSALGKRCLIDFRLNETLEIVNEEDSEKYSEINLSGLGNVYDNKGEIMEGVSKVLNKYKFYTDGITVYRFKSPLQNLNEAALKTKPVINEQFEKMKHLTGYKPNNFVDTKNVKKNRGF
jgi:hypothetical protein